MGLSVRLYIEGRALSVAESASFLHLKLGCTQTSNCCALVWFDFQDCVNEVDLEEKRVKDEERARKEAESGKLTALSIKELLQKLDRPDQNILYYTGGIRLLTGAVKDCKYSMRRLLMGEL